MRIGLSMIERVEKLIIILIVVFFSLALFIFLTEVKIEKSQVKSPNADFSTPFQIKDSEIWVDKAITLDEQRIGLSGQTNIDDNQGLLFVFANSQFHSIWMKDMNFNIDIIWLDENLVVVGIEEDVSPNTFPKAFSAPVPDRYILETRAGFTKGHQISIGDNAKFLTESF